MTVSRASAFIVVAALGVLLTIVGDARQADPGVQLRGAIEREEVAGDLEGAMNLYRQIIAADGKNRAVTARAMLRLAGCYEKLGQAEARKLYERLVADYSDQTQEAASARARLAALAKSLEPLPPAFRKITIPGGVSAGAQLSADGTKLAMASGGDIWVVNLRGQVAPEIAGAPVRLTQGMGALGTGVTWSQDGRWIAFSEGKIPSRDMFVLPASGGTPRRVSRAASILGAGPWWLGLSSDGGRLAYSTRVEDRVVVEIVSVNTGETVMRLASPDAIEPSFSPDDKYVAYTRVGKWTGDMYGEVRVVRLADKTDFPVTRTPAIIRSTAWSPDGTMLAVLAHPDRQRLMVQELWIAAIPQAGKAASEPARMALPRLTLSIAAWTADNGIGLLSSSPSHNAIYTVSLSGGKATQVTPEGDTYNPQWSPDGTRVYFRWGQGDIAYVPAGGGNVSVVPKTGETVRVSLPNGGNHISPDGTRILWAGVKVKTPGVHLWTMPVSGGEPVRLPMKPDLNSFQPRWSPDGKWIAFESERDVAGDRKLDENIFIVSSEGGEPRQLTSHTDCFCEMLAWSPGGDSIAYACTDQIIRIIPARGGEARTILKAEGLTPRQNSLAWTGDGTRLIYSAKGRLWIVPIGGGEPTAITTDLDGNIMQFALSPDGKRIAFNAPSGGDLELWLMEDFLHLVKAAR
jgi:Tol biopolymer transport system component